MKKFLLWTLVLLIAAVSGCLGGAAPKPALSVLECRVALLEPYVGGLAPDLAKAVLAGRPEKLVKTLDELGVTVEEIAALSREWRACNPKPTPAAPPMTVEKS